MNFLNKLFNLKNKKIKNNETNNYYGWNRILNKNNKSFDELEEQLLEADFSLTSTTEIIQILKDKKEYRKDDIIDTISCLFKKNIKVNAFNYDNKKLNVFLMIGINGVGKTTTISKLIYYLKEKKSIDNKDIILGAADTFRAAADEQLKYWANEMKVKIISQKRGSDPSSVCFDTIESALSSNKKIVILDTSGRMHNKINLLEQLVKMKKTINKFGENINLQTFLILDTTLGSSTYQQVLNFQEKIKIDSLILTKTDSTSKGGIIYDISKNLKIPISFITYGEKKNQIKEFKLDEYIKTII